MSKTRGKHSSYFESENRLKHQERLSMIKTSIVRLLFILAVWVIFFWVYSLRGVGSPSFQPIVLSAIALYGFLEVSVLVIRFRSQDEDSALSELIKRNADPSQG